MRQIDNSAVLARQLERLARVRAQRDPAAVEAALQALEAAAHSSERQPNLMDLAVQVWCGWEREGEVTGSEACSAATTSTRSTQPSTVRISCCHVCGTSFKSCCCSRSCFVSAAAV